MTIREMKEKKRELGYSYKKLSELSGVPVGTIQKIFGGETVSPRYDTVQALSAVLSGEPSADENAYGVEYSQTGTGTAGAVREADAGYSVKMVRAGESPVKRASGNLSSRGEKTIEDYLALPEGVRAELIDGKFYDMAAPTTLHQSIAVKIWHILENYILENEGSCMPFVAPVDVQLDCDNRTMVQPDVLVVCDRSKVTLARIVGAPDFVVEIVSPGSAVTDMLVKPLKYRNAGVKEYWIVLPDEKKVAVYDFAGESEAKVYTFDDDIPVGIWEGRCRVDFREICRQLRFFYEES